MVNVATAMPGATTQKLHSGTFSIVPIPASCSVVVMGVPMLQRSTVPSCEGCAVGIEPATLEANPIVPTGYRINDR